MHARSIPIFQKLIIKYTGRLSNPQCRNYYAGIQLFFLFHELQGRRVNESVPPPHHHCFILERNPQNSAETNSSRFLSRLTEDLCMMVSLDKALNWSIQYERENQRNQFTTCLGNVKRSVEQIIEGLANITSTRAPLTYCEMNGNTLVFTDARMRMRSDSEEEEEEVISRHNPNEIPDNTRVSY